jgi:hypothetical protein
MADLKKVMQSRGIGGICPFLTTSFVQIFFSKMTHHLSKSKSRDFFISAENYLVMFKL